MDAKASRTARCCKRCPSFKKCLDIAFFHALFKDFLRGRDKNHAGTLRNMLPFENLRRNSKIRCPTTCAGTEIGLVHRYSFFIDNRKHIINTKRNGDLRRQLFYIIGKVCIVNIIRICLINCVICYAMFLKISKCNFVRLDIGRLTSHFRAHVTKRHPF